MKAIIFAVLAGVFWGVGEVFTKSVLHTRQVGALTAIAVRSTVALPLLWAVWFFVAPRLKGGEPSLLKADPGVLWRLVLGSGVLAGAGGMIFFYLALSFGEVSRVKPIAFVLAPALAALIGVTILGESIDLRKVVALALIMTGLILLTGGGQSPHPA